MNGFEVSVVNFAAKQLVGIKVRTSMAKAKEDCSALWHNFCPKMQKIEEGEGYGISVMINEQEFDYWAAAEAPKGTCPAGLEPVELPAGDYARCVVPNLESIGEVDPPALHRHRALFTGQEDVLLVPFQVLQPGGGILELLVLNELPNQFPTRILFFLLQ